MKQSELKAIIKEELQRVVREDNKINISNQGYTDYYYNINSDIIDTWLTTDTVKKDIKGYLTAAKEAGGAKLVKQVMDAILQGVKESQSLLKDPESGEDLL